MCSYVPFISNPDSFGLFSDINTETSENDEPIPEAVPKVQRQEANDGQGRPEGCSDQH